MPNDGSVDFIVTNEKELLADLNEIERGVPDATKATALSESKKVAQATQSNVPIVSGSLAGTITAREYELGAQIVMGGGSVTYAGWVEWGGYRGRPLVSEGRYLGPAFASRQDEIVEALDKVVAKEIAP